MMKGTGQFRHFTNHAASALPGILRELETSAPWLWQTGQVAMFASAGDVTPSPGPDPEKQSQHCTPSATRYDLKA